MSTPVILGDSEMEGNKENIEIADPTIVVEADTSKSPLHDDAPLEVKSEEQAETTERDWSIAPRDVHGIRWFLVVASMLSSTFFFGLDNTVTANVQPAIVDQFGSINRLPWLSVAFLMGAASTNFFWGQMYGQFDAKWVYIACVLLFEVGSAVCGAAPNMTALIVGRAICGLGGAGMYTGNMTLLSLLTTNNERPGYLGACGLTWGLGTVLGPIIGGAFASSSATWRWAFYINLVIGGACLPVYILLVPSVDPRPAISMRKRFREIDLVGTILMVGILVSVLMAISFGGSVYAWSSVRIIALFVVSGVIFLMFWAQQILCIFTTPERRSFPIQFLRNKELVLLFIVECAASTLTYIPIYFLPLYFQFAKSESAIQSGVNLLPLVIFLVLPIIGGGIIVGLIPRYMPWFFAGGAIGLIGAALLYTIDATTSNAKLYGYSILIGFGAGCMVMLPFSVAQAQVEPMYLPVSVGFICFAQLAAPALLLSIANTVFLNEGTAGIAKIVPTLPKSQIQSILAGVGSKAFAALSPSVQEKIIGVIVKSLDKAFIIAIVCAAVCLIGSCFMKTGRMSFE